MVSLLTTGILTTTQTVLMRVPHIRRALGMPAYVSPRGGGKSILEEIRTIMSKDGDVKLKVAQARREAMSKKRFQETSKGQ